MDQIIINTDKSSKRLIILVSILTSLSVTLFFNLAIYGVPTRAVDPVTTTTTTPTTTTTTTPTATTATALTISSLTTNPTSPTVGTGFTLTVNGTGFISGYVVRFYNVNNTLTIITPSSTTPTMITATISTLAIGTSGGNARVFVSNTTNTVSSSGASFLINNPVPTVNSIIPTSATAGSQGAPGYPNPQGQEGLYIRVYGTGFVKASYSGGFTSQVKINGSNAYNVIRTKYISFTELEAAIVANLSAGTKQITVFNSTPGGGTSSAVILTVNSPPTP